jgi:hypothetical protein
MHKASVQFPVLEKKGKKIKDSRGDEEEYMS